MDPKECLNRIQNALNSGDLTEASDALADYAEWRKRGGFEPMVEDEVGKSGQTWRGDDVKRRLEDQYNAARAVCFVRCDEAPRLALTSRLAAFLDDCVSRDRQECTNRKPYGVAKEKQDTCLRRMHELARAKHISFANWDHSKLCEVCAASWFVTMASITLGGLKRTEQIVAEEERQARNTVPAKLG